jgi:hypothetical protein
MKLKLEAGLDLNSPWLSVRKLISSNKTIYILITIHVTGWSGLVFSLVVFLESNLWSFLWIVCNVNNYCRLCKLDIFWSLDVYLHNIENFCHLVVRFSDHLIFQAICWRKGSYAWHRYVPRDWIRYARVCTT